VSEIGVFAYCAAMGFVTAATISSFYQWVTSERADFLLSRTSPIGIVVAVLISMFCGPFIVMRKVVSGLRSHEIRAVPAALGVIVAGMWSVCAGIFYVSLLMSA
jgi:hypothetical protein